MAAEVLKLLERTCFLGRIIRIFDACKFAYASFLAHDGAFRRSEGVLSNAISEARQAVLRAKLIEIGVALS